MTWQSILQIISIIVSILGLLLPVITKILEMFTGTESKLF